MASATREDTLAGPGAIDIAIEAAPLAARERLRLLRELIAAEVPKATERIAYGLPTWHQGENLVHIGGFAGHVGLYPGPEAIAAFAGELTGLRTSKGAIQLPHDQPLPLELVRRIVRARLAAVASKPPKAKRVGGADVATRDGSKAPTWRDPGPVRFTATLQRAMTTGAACFVLFPEDLKATFGRGNLVPVSTLWDGRVSYRGSLAMMGGPTAMLLCRTDVVTALGKGPGDSVDVEVRLDLTPRPIDVPAALQAALDASPEAAAGWASLSASCKREYADHIADAKRDATREARLAKVLPLIAVGRKLKP